MKDHIITDKAIARTPLYSVDFYKQIVNGNVSIEQIINDPIFNNAIYLASPELYQMVNGLKSNVRYDDLKHNKLRKSILKYIFRASTRCTPFGLFSGVGTIDINDEVTSLMINTPNNHLTHVRFDMDFVGRLSKQLEKNGLLKGYLNYHINSSLYKIGNSYRYINSNSNTKTGVRKFDLNTLESTYIIDKVVKLFTTTDVSFSSLIDCIMDEGFNFDDSVEFVDSLIEEQIIYSELELSTIGLEADFQLIDILERIVERVGENEIKDAVKNIISPIEKLLSTLNRLDTTNKHEIDIYQNIVKESKMLVGDFNEKFLIQADTVIQFLPNANHLSQNIINTVRDGVEVLKKLSTTPSVNAKMTKFIERFVERYEFQEMPLIEVLDAEIGIGYGIQPEVVKDFGGFIDKIPFSASKEISQNYSWNDKLHSLIAKKIISANCYGEKTIFLSDVEINSLSKLDNSLPYNTYSCGFSLYKDDTGNPIIHLTGCGGHSAAVLIGRFCHTHNTIKDIVFEITNQEELLNPDSIVAEINHYPQDRHGNVLQRPILRGYEIPYMANSLIDKEKQLAITDLYISIRDGKVFLRSQKHNKQVLPYLTSALIHEKDSLPIFHFLGDLQNENNNYSAKLNLGILPKVFSHIPRIQYKNIIISPSKWFLNSEDIAKFLKCDRNSETFVTDFNFIADSFQLPQYFLVVHFDNEMPIYRQHIESIHIFLDEIKGKSQVILTEFIASEYASEIQNDSGESMNNEIVLFLSRDKNKTNHSLSQDLVKPLVIENDLKRTYPPGSEWVYLKIYTGPIVADKLVKLFNTSFVDLLNDGIIDKWFFIRYSDPEYHLRLRLRATDIRNVSHVISFINGMLNEIVKNKMVWRINLDTYHRELERYGASHIDYTETLFYIDSVATSSIVASIPDRWRWMAGLYSIESYFRLFNISNDARLKIISEMRLGFEKEFNAEKEARKYLNNTYSSNKTYINELLNNKKLSFDNNRLWGEITEIIDKRNEDLFPVVHEIVNSTDYKQDQIISIIHMNINRLFRTRQRIYEYSFYHFLKNHYTSQLYNKELECL